MKLTDFTRSAAASFLTKVLGAALSLLLMIVVARMLGDEGFGYYVTAVSVCSVLLVVGTMGLNELSIQRVARAKALKQESATTSLVLSFALGAAISVLLLIAVIMAVDRLFESAIPGGFLLVPVVLLIVSQVPLKVGGGVMRGLGYPVAGQIPEAIIFPLISLILISSAFVMYHEDVSASRVLVLQSAGAAVASVVVFGAVASSLRSRGGMRPSIRLSSDWIPAALPFVVLGLLQALNRNADILMLTALSASQEAGYYQAASRLADLVTFGLMAINAMVAPNMASSYAKGDVPAMQLAASRVAGLSFLLGLPIFVGYVFVGADILNVFGEGFDQAYGALVILGLAQVFNATMGPVGVVLHMTGRQQMSAVGVGVATGTNIMMNLILIPPYGVIGAAVATGISIVVWNVFLGFVVWKTLRIDCTVYRILRLLLQRRRAH
jgi:O-antigen/teichoic acid export membrane protein